VLYDNATVESFLISLKNDPAHPGQYADTDEARCKAFAYIELFYNRQRKHESLNYYLPE